MTNAPFVSLTSKSLSFAARVLTAVLLLASAGCAEEDVHEAGFRVRYTGNERRGTLCEVPGARSSSGSGSLVDPGSNADLPHLWVRDHNEDDERFSFAISLVDAYVGETTVPAHEQVLVARTYDESFLTSGETETHEISFEGNDYVFEVRGLRAGESCDVE